MYICIYRLFKFKPEMFSDNYFGSLHDEEEKIMNDFEEKLRSYDLFTFQDRVIT